VGCETVMSGRSVNTDVSDDIIAVIFVVEVSRVEQRVVRGSGQSDGWV